MRNKRSKSYIALLIALSVMASSQVAYAKPGHSSHSSSHHSSSSSSHRSSSSSSHRSSSSHSSSTPKASTPRPSSTPKPSYKVSPKPSSSSTPKTSTPKVSDTPRHKASESTGKSIDASKIKKPNPSVKVSDPVIKKKSELPKKSTDTKQTPSKDNIKQTPGKDNIKQTPKTEQGSKPASETKDDLNTKSQTQQSNQKTGDTIIYNDHRSSTYVNENKSDHFFRNMWLFDRFTGRGHRSSEVVQYVDGQPVYTRPSRSYSIKYIIKKVILVVIVIWLAVVLFKRFKRRNK